MNHASIEPATPNAARVRSGRGVPLATRSRRGGIYVLVLGAATMIAVVGLGAIAISRSDIKSTRSMSDWAKAGVLAEDGVEAAIATMNTSTTWRSDNLARAEVIVGTLAGGTASYRMIDPIDDNLERPDTDPVHVYGYGRAGDAVRSFSLECRYQPAPALDVLKYAVYATGGITVGAGIASGAPLGTPSLTVNSALTANIRVGTLSNNGTVIGEVRTGQTPLITLSDGTLGSLASRGVAINYSSIPGGNIKQVLLSAANNPYGAASPTGIYFIRVPLLSTLKMTDARISATLIVELGLSSRFETDSSVCWDAADAALPTLVINATALSSVRFHATPTPLSESSAGTNFNPASTPYSGQSDTDKADEYPSRIRGVVHVMSTLASVQLDQGTAILGTLICQGSLAIDGGSTVTYDPQVLQSPPSAYQTGAATMTPVAGTWKWELLP